MPHAILLISCPDQKGITAGVTNFIYAQNGNIVHADQHIDEQSNTFFMRIEWDLKEFRLPKEEIAAGFAPLSEKFKMKAELYFTDQRPRVAVFASRRLHCVQDLLLRYREGQLPCEISVIISNHSDAALIAAEFGIKFVEIPVTQENKHDAEQTTLGILREENIDLVILARYHQIFTPEFVDAFKSRIINIHHSFLPAFAGKDPYAQAYEKGVKIIGATSHYVTPDLDQGPIIDQDTIRVSHRDALDDLKRKGEDLEKLVLSRSVRLALEHKILAYGNKTVVFD